MALETGNDLSATGKEIYEDMSSLFKEKRDQFRHLDPEDIAELRARLHERWEETREDIEETLAG
jgi:hypothetical protein